MIDLNDLNKIEIEFKEKFIEDFNIHVNDVFGGYLNCSVKSGKIDGQVIRKDNEYIEMKIDKNTLEKYRSFGSPYSGFPTTENGGYELNMFLNMLRYYKFGHHMGIKKNSYITFEKDQYYLGRL